MKKLSFTLATACLAMAAGATPLSPEQALRRAAGDTPARIAGNDAKGKFTLASTLSHEDMAGVYLYTRNDGNGFIVASADDCAPALLGYGSSQATDSEGKMAPGMEYWLTEMARQVAYAAEHPSTVMSLHSRPERAPIAPLCTTTWNQGAPYNDRCPSKNGETAVTGCVATSMAQVMKYHNWPDAGVGMKSYRSSKYGNLRVNFAKEPFAWDKMLDSYTGEEPEENTNAVATLMMCAGYSVEMDYSPAASGAAAINIATALGEYFKYDRSLQYLYRDYYALYDWENIIYNSLVNDGPVIYDGQAGIGGHSFVCDGYDTDGYFHFNWGWGGMSDGYFLLDALDPMHQGIGGADGGFDFLQDIVVGIRPDTEGTSTWNAEMIISGDLDLTTDKYVGEDETVDLIVCRGLVYNNGPGPLENAWMGYRYSPVDGSKPVVDIDEIGESVPVGYGFQEFEWTAPSLPDGTYTVELVYRLGAEGELRVIKAPLINIDRYLLTVENGQQTFEAIEPAIAGFEDAVFPETIYLNEPVTVTGILENPGDTPTYAPLSLVVVNEEMTGILAYSYPTPYDLEGMESKDVTLTTMLSNRMGNPADGTKALLIVGIIDFRTGMVYFISDAAEVTLNRDSGVEQIERENGISATDAVYTLSGIKVKRPAGMKLPAGTYILHDGTQTRKVIIK